MSNYRHAMIIDRLRQRLHEGFHPFTLELSSGRRYSVPHRDFIAVHPKMVVVIDQEGVSHTINPLHIVALDEAEPQE